MIAIRSYIHRNLLKDMIRRWMYNEVQPADALLKIMQAKGLVPGRTKQEFKEFVLSGEQCINLEIIVSS